MGHSQRSGRSAPDLGDVQKIIERAPDALDDEVDVVRRTAERRRQPVSDIALSFVIANLARFERGEEPLGRVDPDVGY